MKLWHNHLGCTFADFNISNIFDMDQIDDRTSVYSSLMISHFLLFRFYIFRASTLSDNSLFFSIFLTSSKNQFRF